MFWDTFNCIGPQNEDCLYLNIFGPELDPMKKYPVMFYIHGGGFMMDSSLRYTPRNVCRNLCSKGIIVVTIHYRLGYLGYFCTGDEASPGNYGLYDQIEALKWVKKNIEQFGGDPDNITVAGQSAGAVSADLLSLSPLSRDLFKNKMVLGANSFCHWAVTTPEACRAYCRKKAVRLGWTAPHQFADLYEESRSIMDFMRKVPASKLGSHMIGKKLIFRDCVLPLAPVIGDEALPRPLEELRKEAPEKPSIVGVGEQESLLFIAIGLMKCNRKELEQHISTLCRKTGRNMEEVLRQMNRLYGDSPQLRGSKRHLKEMIVTMLSDIISNHAAYLYMRHHSEGKAPSYVYSFDHSSKNTWGWLSAVVPFTAGTHTSEITYLFDCNYFSSPFPMNDTDKKVQKIMSTYITLFIKNGTPNSNQLPEWRPVDPDRNLFDLQVMSITDMPQMKSKVRIVFISIWSLIQIIFKQ
ncbi:hypothetical protein WR25_07042 isoform C [Diploscapter pachys]|uniref:Carboxylic ester hydrolase n=1 Tax=Diploscapter pachys TaxID=2018661 RepID=A0A2A2JSC6_9BILA|nr:hypothetical protein WR25_07042 isoform C [Diploscapter pachys]